MTEFNYRTALNRRLRQDAEDTRNRGYMALCRIQCRSVNARLRKLHQRIAIDAALVGVILMAVVALLACAVS